MNKITFFSKDINLLYATELDKIKKIAQSQNIDYAEHDWQIDNDVIRVMSQFWSWPDFKIERTAIVADNGQDTYGYEEGDKFLNKITHFSMGFKRTLYYITYSLPLDMEHCQSVIYAQPGSEVSCWGIINNGKRPNLYFFSEKELDDNEINIIKGEKEKILNKLDAGIIANNLFYEEKIKEAKFEVDGILKKRFEDLKKRREINKKL